MRGSAAPERVFSGSCLVVAPHMDDCILSCGGSVAALARPQAVHFVYATDGSMSPVPAGPGRRRASAELPPIRMREAREALATIGLPAENARFLGLPDGALRAHGEALRAALRRTIEALAPDTVLVPFRYDRHPDHLAVTRASLDALDALHSPAAVREYFVYYRWRLLPGGDVRRYLDEAHVERVDISAQAELKRKALDCFVSQTTRFYPWQDRPILTEDALAEVCANPEWFLRRDPARPGAAIFPRRRTWIRVAHFCEPRIKTWKERAKGWLSREGRRRGRN